MASMADDRNAPVVIENNFDIQFPASPDAMWSVLGAESAYNHLAEINGLGTEADMPGLIFLVDGERAGNDVGYYSYPQCMVFGFGGHSYQGVEKMVYFAIGRGTSGVWRMSAKCLLLPQDDPEEWGTDDEATMQRGAYILHWLADLLQYQWWRLMA